MAKRTLALSLVGICALLLEVTACNGGSTPSSNPPAAPTVLSTAPGSGATGVAANATVTVTFSEAMDPATVNATTFTVKDPTGAAVAGTVACSGTTATFTGPLTPLVTYTADVTTGVKSLAGKALEAEHPWSFTVATTPTPLLSRATLKAWIDDGLVNGTGSERVLVLDFSPTYATGHVPGSHQVNITALWQSRKEGPAVDVNMVPEGARMDAFVQAYGIDGHTTIVFTGSGAGITSPARAYWTFRYWGFAKEKLKFLDGLDNGWSTAYGLTPDAPAAITPSTYSVRSNVSLRSDLRASLTEMMAEADGTAPDASSAVILDTRAASGTGSYAGVPGSTQGVFDTSDFVVFEGHMNGAKAMDFKSLYDASTFEFLTPADLATNVFNPLGIDATKTTYVHCRTGVIASVPFFVLDAILDWPVRNYDGSWSQWGQLSAESTNGGQLAADSPWRTDTSTYSQLVVYNHSNATKNYPVELLAANGSTCSATLATDSTVTYVPAGCDTTPGFTGPDSSLLPASGNQIEEADALYMTQ